MSYLDKFPQIDYLNIVVRDITRKTSIKDFLKNNISLFEPYRIKDGDRPETLAHDFYGDANLHWVILLINDIIDPFFDWVLSDSELKNYIDEKYGVGQGIVIRHWVLNDVIVPSGTTNAVSVTNEEFEISINEAKREIKIVQSIYIDKIVSEFESKILE